MGDFVDPPAIPKQDACIAGAAFDSRRRVDCSKASALNLIYGMLEQRDGPKLFLPAVGAVEDERGDEHDRSEGDREHRHRKLNHRVHGFGPRAPTFKWLRSGERKWRATSNDKRGRF